MPISSRTFRVFVSSTFTDLQAERNALHRQVFSKLREFCESRGCRFQPIDLRWGVREEAALNQRTMEICLAEIERCQRTGVKPNFIVLLGDRYGWRPLPGRVPAAEFERVVAALPGDADRSLACEWYRRDDNAVPPAYFLRGRSGEFTDALRWARLEERLHRLLRTAARAAGLSQAALIKYEASATHQEILKGLGSTPADAAHVFAFLRSLPDPPEPRGAYSAFVDPDPEDRHALRALRADLHSTLADRVFEYAAQWEGQGVSTGHLRALCTDVSTSLTGTIEQQIQSFESDAPLAQETRIHEGFGRERCRHFVGRRAVLGAVAAYVRRARRSNRRALYDLWRGRQDRPLVLSGGSGTGKSSVMAKAASEVRRAVVVQRYVGITPGTTTGEGLLRSVCNEIARAYRAPVDLPDDLERLKRLFDGQLELATPRRPLTVFLDALDQLPDDDPLRRDAWLPHYLPPHARIVISTTSPLNEFRTAALLELDEMPDDEAEQALDGWLANAGRALQAPQRNRVLQRFRESGRLPLYLRLAFDEARTWASFTPDGECQLGPGVAGMIDTTLDRLAEDANHGPTFVARALGYLAASRFGLTEDEVLEVLSADGDVMADFEGRSHHQPPERRLPVVVWSRLFLDLEPYLSERSVPGGSAIVFYHRQVLERVAERYLAGQDLVAWHAALARYFAAQPPWLDTGCDKPNRRAATELIYQLLRAGAWHEASRALLDYTAISAKCRAGMETDLIREYAVLLGEAPQHSLAERGTLVKVSGALRMSTSVLFRDWRQLPSQMTARLLGFDEAGVRAFLAEVVSQTRHPWLRPLSPSLSAPGGPLEMTLAGHETRASAVVMSPDGRFAVSGSRDETIRVWDLEAGSQRRVITGSVGWVSEIAITPDGRLLVSGADSGELVVWDLDSGGELARWQGYDGAGSVAISGDGCRVTALSPAGLTTWNLKTGSELRTVPLSDPAVPVVGNWIASPDGRFIATVARGKGFTGGKVTVWDAVSGARIRDLEDESLALGCLAVTPDGKWVIAGTLWGGNTERPPDTYPIRIWDIASGAEVARLVAHATAVTTLAVSSDGRRLVSGSIDGALVVWDLRSGRPLLEIPPHQGRLETGALSPDGTRFVSVCDDGRLMVWNLTDSPGVAVSQAAQEPVRSLARTPDGHVVVVSQDSAVHIWDTGTCREVGQLQSDCKAILSVVVTPDGRTLALAAPDETLDVWDLAANEVLCRLPWTRTLYEPAALAADGRTVLASSGRSTVTVWDTDSGREICTFSGHSGPLCTVAAFPDGQSAASGTYDTESGDPEGVRVWGLKTGQERCHLPGAARPRPLAATPDGRLLLVPGPWGIDVWDVERAETVGTLRERTRGTPNAMAIARDGRRVAVAYEDVITGSNRDLRVWRLHDSRQIAGYTADAPLEHCVIGVDDVTVIAADKEGRFHFLRLEGDTTRAWAEEPEIPSSDDETPAEFDDATTDHDGVEDDAARGFFWPRKLIAGHTAELRHLLSPVPLVWFLATVLAAALPASPWPQRILAAPIYGAGIAYIPLCCQLWRFFRPGLRPGLLGWLEPPHEPALLVGGLAGLPILIGVVSLLLAPVDLWWAQAGWATLQDWSFRIPKAVALLWTLRVPVAVVLTGRQLRGRWRGWSRFALQLVASTVLPGALFAGGLFAAQVLLAFALAASFGRKANDQR